ncbi:Pullulanase OS=Tsukamurella paurometabola (strain ATCC 8368 / DSM / CCUG 35730 / CIP 100753/ JCM 10117 / KCTC 9821 / NBRC 16120 / NCIMB 702349 / NCTC 13040)OX=521096 GN=Tpau_4221 PE=4 SV=1 [Tsukamurella paurometabola]|uniref:Pullulanase n=1 Tax=Tsukamurella paurometabola (strain ATCC 8368 / DSM 20162 / CCUG 35730 / CIP 100753 / JCM 10117 / KCTC 9821 / NBRC 16120 / NCIMB 702349 / NCTC 13040) TaxID=521096 RepID=D5UP80_TSUPD|nr:hypothetical protein [Tsukamurella paurometabola]ADG80789.1 conserved hypothetical protein [Tsukamurella paurometabola DSM 20162]SUP40993.1 Uncharacterised protein [Tsukamurella paurometabola]
MGDDGAIEYWFGLGDGQVSTWRSPALDGAVLLDFDGDARADDTLLDLDADGRADIAALDLDDDGTAESRFRDDGSGLWAQREASAPSRCAAPEAATPAAPAPAPPQTPAHDPDGPVQPVTPVPAEPGQAPRQAVVDEDGDGTPDVLLFDTDGDGTADGAVDVRHTEDGMSLPA